MTAEEYNRLKKFRQEKLKQRLKTSRRFHINELFLSGVYKLYWKNKVVYVGQSKNIIRRINQHFEEMEKEFDSFAIINCSGMSDNQITELEITLIKRYLPIYNKDHKNLYNLK